MTEEKVSGEAEPKEEEAEQQEKPEPSLPDSGTQGNRPTVRTLDGSAYRPIVSDDRVGRLGFVRNRTPMRPWVARVFVQSNGRMTAFDKHKQPTAGELLWGGFRSVFEVDLSLQQLSLEITLPSMGDAFVFRAEVDIQWRVKNPESVVAEGLRDIRPVLVPPLLAGLREASRALMAADVQTAEKAVNAQFPDDWLLADYGLWTNVLVRLRMDEQKERNVRLEAEVAAYKELIKDGDLDQFALQLAQNPKDVEPVVRALVDERDTHRREVFDFITRLIESDALDRWQIDDQVRIVMQWMQTSINRVLTGTDAARQLSFEDRAGDTARNGAGGA
ncbi:hypothetical protein [Amycolatopsis sp. DG1A-15b]|uniref:hypothetical protein n=1 Tax=Amycolatopsis sp. DG1A-15b TaxID=3052846 RepID=UPI00255B91C4|nr:hypothetical protein [Amycolatopsis sp. DG1A-15b]WIX85523.1 hypothetical protein QRY02_30370 [Amycolatopsis sp. DG1A-15b]